MTIVTVHQAKTHLSKLIAQVMAGEEIVIAKGKEPVAKISSIGPAAKPKRMPGRMKGKISIPDSFFDPLPDDELVLWNGEGD